MVEVECGGFVFTSNFESGNLARVEQVPLPPKPSLPPNSQQQSSANETPDYEFNVWTNPDCAGTEFENGNRSWFYFGIRGGTPSSVVKINLVNLNRQVKMYSQGMAPVFRVLPGRAIWDRIRDKPTYTLEDNVFTLSFRFRTMENSKCTTYFAFTFPYSYQDLMSALKNFDKRFKNNPPPEKYLPGVFTSGLSPDDIYYHRELAIHSLDGRRLDLLTISSHHGMTATREPRFKNLFPDTDTPRPYMFAGKKVIFVSARVHPGEVPSSYVLNGLIEALLNKDDLTSILLRRMYVFKIIPMLNPDGVARGHFRTDTRGVNLNRVYITPSLQYHPTIFAARAIIKFAHYGREVADDEETLDSKCFNGQAAPSQSSVSPGAQQGRAARRSVSIQRTQSTRSLPQDAVLATTSVHSLRPAVSLPQSLQTAHRSGEDAAAGAPLKAGEDSVSPEELEAVEMDVERTKDEDEPGKKKTFSAVFPSENVLPTATKAHTLPESDKPHTEHLRVTHSALELSFRQVMNFSAQKSPHHGLNQCNAEEAPEVVKERKLRRKHHVVGSSRLIKRHMSRSAEDDFVEETARLSTFHENFLIGASVKPTLDPSKSNLFLYMDMHGHASKKGIFMYGNHFDDLDQLVECMLLPKIMSINSQNFHFNACNFTERNMYLKDRRDGMSREGCGRVAVMKMTGLVRSYTLECNYNTGRIVNLLPPCVRDYTRMSVNAAYAVPPKYTPLVFEDVGRALAVSILDVTNSNPCSRIPNSDYRTVSGIREWLRTNCMSDNQLWMRMLHRPTRQLQQQQLQQQQVDKRDAKRATPSPTAAVAAESYQFDASAPAVGHIAESSISWEVTALNEQEPLEAYPFPEADHIGKDLSEDTISSLNNCDRSYNRRRAFEYEKELEEERRRVLERLRSERLLAAQEGSNAENKYDIKALLEEELEKKREKVRKIREHEKLVREKFNKLCDVKQPKSKDQDEGEGGKIDPSAEMVDSKTTVEEMNTEVTNITTSKILLQGEINEIVAAMVRVEEIREGELAEITSWRSEDDCEENREFEPFRDIGTYTLKDSKADPRVKMSKERHKNDSCRHKIGERRIRDGPRLKSLEHESRRIHGFRPKHCTEAEFVRKCGRCDACRKLALWVDAKKRKDDALVGDTAMAESISTNARDKDNDSCEDERPSYPVILTEWMTSCNQDQRPAGSTSRAPKSKEYAAGAIDRHGSDRVTNRRSKGRVKVVLNYSDQTDSDISEQIVREIYRRENADGHIRRDSLFVVIIRKGEERPASRCRSKGRS